MRERNRTGAVLLLLLSAVCSLQADEIAVSVGNEGTGLQYCVFDRPVTESHLTNVLNRLRGWDTNALVWLICDRHVTALQLAQTIGHVQAAGLLHVILIVTQGATNQLSMVTLDCSKYDPWQWSPTGTLHWTNGFHAAPEPNPLEKRSQSTNGSQHPAGARRR